MIHVPEAFIDATLRREGEAGRDWLARLPQQASVLAHEWHLSLDGPVLFGGLSVVVLVRRGAERCALRIPWPHPAHPSEVAALRAWNGSGAVKVLAANDTASLLERLNHSQTLEHQPVEEALMVAGGLLRRLAIAAPPTFPALQDHVQTFPRDWPKAWERVGRPFPKNLLSHALDLALGLAESAHNRLIHTDLHFGNVLAGAREPWLAIDPKVLVGDVEYGVAPLLWTRLEELEAGAGAAWALEVLVRAAQLNAERARAWSLVRAVDYWLWGLSHGLTSDPERCRRLVAELLT